MGQEQSSLPSADGAVASTSGSQARVGEPEFGFQVLLVQPHSPGEEAGLQAYCDFIVAVKQQPSATGAQPAVVPLQRTDLSRIAEAMRLAAEASEQKKEVGSTTVVLVVYNLRTERYREVVLRPRNGWGGKGSAGLSIRCSELAHAREFVFRVLDIVDPNLSPAGKAGLQAGTDYIVGGTDANFREEDDFFSYIFQKERGEEVAGLYVYNADSDDVRLVDLKPSRNWGGEGLMGCNVGFGLLHRVPMKVVPNRPAVATTPQQPAPGPAFDGISSLDIVEDLQDLRVSPSHSEAEIGKASPPIEAEATRPVVAVATIPVQQHQQPVVQVVQAPPVVHAPPPAAATVVPVAVKPTPPAPSSPIPVSAFAAGAAAAPPSAASLFSSSAPSPFDDLGSSAPFPVIQHQQQQPAPAMSPLLAAQAMQQVEQPAFNLPPVAAAAPAVADAPFIPQPQVHQEQEQPMCLQCGLNPRYYDAAQNFYESFCSYECEELALGNQPLVASAAPADFDASMPPTGGL